MAATSGAPAWSDDTAVRACVDDVDTFAARAWGHAPWLTRSPVLTSLLTRADVEHLVGGTALRAPAFRVVRDGATLPASEVTRSARVGSRPIDDLIDPAKVTDLYADGATIVLQGLQRYWPPLTSFCRALARGLGHPVQANAYVTPASARGLGRHADPHHVFAVQTDGAKRWIVEGAAGSLDVDLHPGDCLYVPQGITHAAGTAGSASIHIAVGVRAVTWADLVSDAVSAAVERVGREPLPMGWAADTGATGAALRERVDAVVAELAAFDPDAAVAASARSRLAGERQPRTALADLLRLDDVDDATALVRRCDATVEQAADGRVALCFEGRDLRLPVAAAPAVHAVLSRRRFTVGDLAEHLTPGGRLALVRRLVREGLLALDTDA